MTTSIKKEIMEEFEKLWRKEIKLAGHDNTNPLYKLTNGLGAFESFLSQALTRIEEAAREEIKAKCVKYKDQQLSDPWSYGMNIDMTDGYARAMEDIIASLSPSEEKEAGYMGKVTNAGNIASSEKDSVCNCDGTVHRKSSHSPKKEKRGR